jgi:hypothetical protein
MTATTLSSEESALVWCLREIPEGKSRDELAGFLRELFTYVRDPKCAQAQADGVPCPVVGRTCDECCDVAGLVELLHAYLSSEKKPHPAV